MSDSEELDRHVEAGWALARERRTEEAVAHLRRLVELHPDEPRAHFELGSLYDSLEREQEAVVLYNRAVELGLPEVYMPKLLLQLGSTLRNVGDYAGAVRVLREGRSRFAEYAPLRFFLALALHSSGREREAFVELLELAASAPNPAQMREYGRAMRGYTEAIKGQPSGAGSPPDARVGGDPRMESDG